MQEMALVVTQEKQKREWMYRTMIKKNAVVSAADTIIGSGTHPSCESRDGVENDQAHVALDDASLQRLQPLQKSRRVVDGVHGYLRVGGGRGAGAIKDALGSNDRPRRHSNSASSGLTPCVRACVCAYKNTR